MFSDCYRNKTVLLTGHTGFKGSWLALWLQHLGAKVVGLALNPDTSPNHWDLLNDTNNTVDDRRVDIRNTEQIITLCRDIKPDIVFHLAAQALVRRSYKDPITTWQSNVMGTANVLEACRKTESVQAIVVVTTDKCYENKEWHWGYRENDNLGGHDPYAASKAAVELLVGSYRQSFFSGKGTPLLATARAGNVIGGGDWSEDRLIPDIARSVTFEKTLIIRSPHATRPWQHVLESLSGYLLLGQRLLAGENALATAWNFGPTQEANLSVQEVLVRMQQVWPQIKWQTDNAEQLHEANLLYLDSSKARQLLPWQPVWNVNQSLHKTAAWYQSFIESQTLVTNQQLVDYISDARKLGVCWS
ncbi:MAG: CDP-glucose 4,6-dehydratase [Mariprofundales bacterium]